jgi:hypothetical protein
MGWGWTGLNAAFCGTCAMEQAALVNHVPGLQHTTQSEAMLGYGMDSSSTSQQQVRWLIYENKFHETFCDIFDRLGGSTSFSQMPFPCPEMREYLRRRVTEKSNLCLVLCVCVCDRIFFGEDGLAIQN